MTKEEMVALAQGQLDDYNRRDLDSFCKHYHKDVQVYGIGQSPEKRCEGIEAFREIYRARFDSSPELHCELKSRVVLNNSVIDEEWVTGTGAPQPSHVAAIYHFKDGLISAVWFTR